MLTRELPTRAQEIAGEVERLAPPAEREGELGPELLGLLREAGLLRLATPVAAGGLGADLGTQVDAIAALAEADASTAWVVAAAATAGNALARAPEPVARRVYAAGPDAVVCGSGTPTRTVTRDGDGFRLSGRWPGVIGSAQADVVLVYFAPDGEPGHLLGRAALPAAALTRRRTWGATGLRAAGSDTVVADDVPVAADEVEWLGGSPEPDPLLSLLPAAVAVGVASGAVRRAVAQVRVRPWAGTSYAPAASAASVQSRLADAAMHADDARLHVTRAVATLPAADAAARARCRADAGWAVRAATAAVDAVMSVLGSDAVAEEGPIERAWRDLATLSRHGAVDPLIAREAYGRVLLGVDGGIARLPL